jgi:hypothetical protein
MQSIWITHSIAIEWVRDNFGFYIDSYVEDFIQERDVADDIERDAYDIGFLTEDYMDGNYDAVDAPEIDNYDEYN